MYNPEESYETNYQTGPQKALLKNGVFPVVEYSDTPQFEFLGQPLHIPFGIPAGPLLNSLYVNVALEAGFSLPTYKTVRSAFHPSHPVPNILKISSERGAIFQCEQNTVLGKKFLANEPSNETLSISNSFGVPSKNPSEWQKDFSKINLAPGSAVVLSFQGTRLSGFSDFVQDTLKAAQFAADALRTKEQKILEINLSCPNEGGRPLFYFLEDCVTVLSEVQKVVKEHNLKLIAKIGALSEAALEAFVFETIKFVDGYSAINTVSAEIRNEIGDIVLGSGSLTGGVCGDLIFQQGLETVSALSKVRKKLRVNPRDCVLIGVGGVSNADQFLSYREAGADVVQAGTAAMWNLNLAAEIASKSGIRFKHSYR